VTNSLERSGALEMQMDKTLNPIPYVLITPARNEERFIEKLIESVIHQTVLPEKWVIVNDGSTDATASIVSRYVEKYDWMELLNLSPRRDRSFAAKVHAFNAGFARVKNLEFEVVGNLDSDLSFEADYLEFLLNKFREDASLGVAGTIFREEGYSSATTVLKVRTTLQVVANYFDVGVSNGLADTSRTRREESIGSQSQRPA